MPGMKICMTTLEYPPETGGVGESVRRIAGMMVEQGHEVHVVVFHTKRRKQIANGVTRKGLATSEDNGIIVHHYRTVMRGEGCAVQEFLSDVYAELQALHTRERFDIFHSFYINETGFLTTLLAREVDVPVINSIRGADIHRNIFNPTSYSQILWALEHSSWATFVSRQLEARAHILAPSIRERTSAFWNSIVPVDFDALEYAPCPEKLQGTVIGSFGNFRDKKGIDFLVWACEALADNHDLSLLLVGDFIAKEKQFWDDFISNSPIADRIAITGRLSREQALAHHHHVDIFAIPSLRDGCPNALIEAMLFGQAIIGSSSDAIGEILEHERDALVVRPGHTEDLVDALQRLVSSPDLRQQLGAAARHKALEQLSPECEQQNWLEVYERVATANRPRMVEVNRAV